MDFTIGKDNSALWLLPQLAMEFVNIPYIYGGKCALTGLDCSGLVCELLGAIGLIPRNAEFNAQGIYDHFKDISTYGEIAVGSLAFYGKSTSDIHHIGLLLDINFMIEAGHGDSTTTTLDAAKKKDAKSRVSRWNFRKDLVNILRPHYGDYDLHN
jgi:cell wall-associated NlpC family hydrolase